MLLVRPWPGMTSVHGSFLRNRFGSACQNAGGFQIQGHATKIAIKAKLKVNLITIGKKSGKDAVFDALVAEYAKRMSREISMLEKSVKRESAAALVQELAQRESVMLMDEKGEMPRDSLHFSEMVFAALEEGGSRLSIVVGDADGLPLDLSAIKSPRIRKVSLSPLTFTHKMVRLFIYEQLYRATEIRKNSKYHK